MAQFPSLCRDHKRQGQIALLLLHVQYILPREPAADHLETTPRPYAVSSQRVCIFVFLCVCVCACATQHRCFGRQKCRDVPPQDTGKDLSDRTPG